MILPKLTRHKGQAALEYLILLTVAAVVVFIAVKPSGNNSLLNRSQKSTEGYYNTVTEVIMGKNPDPIDGGWCRPAKPNGECECACPAPAFGGRYCVTDGECRSSAPGTMQFCGDGICTHGLETGQPGNPGGLLTCFEDCAYQTDCSTCGQLIPSATCGIPCPINRCNNNSVCMTSECAPSCPGFRQECRENPLLCTSTCRCPAPSLQPVGATCGGTCGPYQIGPNERCFRYNVAQCTGTCSNYELYVGRVSAGCNSCVNGIRDGTEIAIDCGGTCQSCCGNTVLDPGEQCDDGDRNDGDGCSRNCLLDANCTPNDVCPRAFPGSPYCCGEATNGRNVPAGNAFCTISQRCDPGETQANCPEDCSPCVPNGNCVSPDGTYTCGAETTTGVSENCPTIPCTIPQRCDPTENCETCPADCPRGACIADSTYQCGAPTPEGHYSNCPSIDCSIPQGCDTPAENCTTCPGDCGTCLCTGATPPGSIACPDAETNVLSTTPKVLVGSCGSAKCEFTCGPGYAYINGACVCQTGTCDGACLPLIVNTGAACGSQPITLPGVRHGEISRVDCPGPCVGHRWALCFNSNFLQVHGDCGAEGCPATTAPHPFCGTATWPSTPVTGFVLGTCGELCTGYTQRNCWPGGVWSGGYSYSADGPNACVLLPTASCPASSYTSPCGVVDIPPLVSGQTYTTSCPTGGSGCFGGTISAACVDGTVSTHNNCHRCGNNIKDGTEVCDGDTVACTAPDTGYKTCRSNCSGYEDCVPFGCDDLTVSVGNCGSVTLAGVDDTEVSSSPCPAGCTGTISATCDQKDFVSISGTCTSNPCDAAIVDTECGRVTLLATTSGQTSSADCPSGCPGSVSAVCSNGSFSALQGACSIDSCPATSMAVPCTAPTVTMPAGRGGQTQSVLCPAGCTGTLYATCNSGSYTGNSGSCVPANCLETQVFTACGDASLGAVNHEASTSIDCPGGCGGTINATCRSGQFCIGGTCYPSGSFINNEDLCTPDCTGFDYGFDLPNTCPLVPIPTVANDSSTNVACAAGCTGSLTASCLGGDFTITGSCTEAPCTGESVTPPPPGADCSLWFGAADHGDSVTVNCSTVGCVGSLQATCERGHYRNFSGSCNPCNPNGTCAGPETITNCPADCGCDNDGTCEANRQETNVSCAADCGCNNNGTCQAQRGETTANCVGDCPPPRCSATTMNTLCGLVNIPTTLVGSTGSFDCTTIGCIGTASIPCVGNESWGNPTGGCSPPTCPSQSGSTGVGNCDVSYNITGDIVGASKPIGCGVLCTGTRDAVCQADLTWRIDSTCAPIQCPPTSIPLGATCNDETLELLNGNAGESQDPDCPAVCPGTITYSCGVSGTWSRIAGGCTPL
jgi:hypothetical protein